METYNYENINLEVTTADPFYVDFTGETTLTLESDFVSELIENSCAFFEFFMTVQEEELYSELEEDIDKIAEHFKNLQEDVDVRNADAIIAVYEYALENNDKEYTFKVETENISWAIHDMLHAKHDLAGCTIYVASEVEKERIIESLTITKEKFPHLMPDYDFLENLENEFSGRFRTTLDLEEFKYLEEDYYSEDEY